MSKQRVFKLGYLPRGKTPNKRSSALFQVQKHDCHLLIPSPHRLLTSWSSGFFYVIHFLICGESRKYSPLWCVIGWGLRQSSRDLFQGGSFAFTRSLRSTSAEERRAAPRSIEDTCYKALRFPTRLRECPLSLFPVEFTSRVSVGNWRNKHEAYILHTFME